jgi:hypothetical protein
MTDFIARLFEPLLRLMWPAPGRHRSTGAPATPRADVRPAVVPVVRESVPPVPLLRGEDTPLVRPYLVVHEQRQREEARRQRGGRRELWLAVHGIDLGPRVIHGIEVAA